MDGHVAAISCLSHCDGIFVTGSRDGMVRAWEIETAESMCVFDGDESPVWEILFEEGGGG